MPYIIEAAVLSRPHHSLLLTPPPSLGTSSLFSLSNSRWFYAAVLLLLLHLLLAGHSTIADCWVAFGVLTDDVARYRKGVDLYHVTVGDYLRWGRGDFKANRIVGEVGGWGHTHGLVW
jgi:hypothetical protein